MIRKVLFWIFILLIIILIFTIFNHYHKELSYKNNIITKSYKDDSIEIKIKYPRTNTKLDKDIIDYINNIANDFKNNYGDSDYLNKLDELKIDYDYAVYKKRYISLVLTTTINSYKLSSPIIEVKNYLYDLKKDKYFYLNDLLSIHEQKNLYNYIKEQLLTNYFNYIIINNIDTIIPFDKIDDIPFFIGNDYLLIYFTPEMLASDYYDVLIIKTPIKIDFANN